METTKIRLSTDELLAINNHEWILTKNRVIEKIAHAMGHLSMRMQQEAEEKRHQLINEMFRSNPKISRGEKYEGLPYIMLAYPRIFEKDNILAIRTFFWWGNFCSITLHVKGKYQEIVLQKLLKERTSLQEAGFYISMSGNEWNHDVTTSDYQLLSSLAGKSDATIMNSGFLKLAAKIALNQWDKMETELYRLFLILLKLVEV